MQITAPFNTSTRAARLERRNDRTHLLCDARRKDNTWAPSSIDLDAHIGNSDGKFDTSGNGSNFTASAQHLSLDSSSSGVVLRAQLRDCGGVWRDATTRPEDWLVCADGRVRFGRRADDTAGLRAWEVVADDRTFVLCESRRGDGAWGAAKMDLDAVVGNDNGRFDVTGSGSGFTRSARGVKLRWGGPGGDRPLLAAELKDVQGEWRRAEVDLTEVVRNVDGRLEFHGRETHGPQ